MMMEFKCRRCFYCGLIGKNWVYCLIHGFLYYHETLFCNYFREEENPWLK